jgi:hypothetical protein
MIGLLSGTKNLRPELKKKMNKRGMPPFTTRRKHDKLGKFATVRGFSPVPIYSSINNIWVDDINLDGCKYPIDMESHLRKMGAYNKSMWLVNALKHVYKKELKLTDAQTKDMTFKQAFAYSDYIISSLFNFGKCQ